MMSVSGTSSYQQLDPIIHNVQGGLLVSLLISFTSRARLPPTTHFSAPFSLWSKVTVPPVPSIVQSSIGQLVVTNQLPMFSLQYGILKIPTINLRTRERESERTRERERASNRK